MDKNISVYTQLTMYAPLITILLTLSPHLVAIKTSFCNVHKMTQALLMILIGFLVVSIIFLYRHYFLNHTSTRIKRILQILDRKSTRLNSSHANISYAVFCL